MGQIKRIQLADVIQQVSRKMLPFYRKIAADDTYASRWSRAVVTTNLTRLTRLFNQASPNSGALIGTNSIGYFADFEYPQPIVLYSSGTTIPPGTAQSVFPPRDHQAVAAAIIPFYRSLAYNRVFAVALSAAILKNNLRAVKALVRSRIKTRALKSIRIESTGVALTFRFPFSPYTFRNLLEQDESVSKR